MPGAIDRSQVQELLRQGAQLVEVLPPSDFREVHLPGAVNIPLKELTAETAGALDPHRVVICYCFDYQ